jgi:pimeloyl-ACP methyl ester carboxylesterase
MTTSLNQSIQMQFRTIDGLSIRFAESEDRDDHALLLSPWPESLLAFQRMVVGSGGSAFPLQLGSVLKDWVEAPDLEAYRRIDPRQIVGGALSSIERYVLPDSVREDYLSSYEGDPFVESMRYVRTYPTELPVLRDLLPRIETPVQIIAGARDPAVPPVNAEFLHERLPKSKLDIIDAGHFNWEEAPDEYAALVTSWWSGGYANTGTEAGR